VDDVIKQTRCSTCDFEHPYKDGKLPTRRTKKDGTSALYKQVLENVSDGTPEEGAGARSAPPMRPVLARPDAPRSQPVTPEFPASPSNDLPAPAPVAPPPAAAAPARLAPAPAAPAAAPAPAAPAMAAAPPPASPAPQAAPGEDRPQADEAIVHRRLIRAQLPRVEGAEREPRPIPTFTVHEAANARAKFRRFPRPGHQGHGNGSGQGPFNGNAMPRFGHGGQPSPFGAGRGHGKGGGQHPNRGGGQQQHGNRANQQQRRGNKGR
jgi:translation initiation factor IF-2